MDRVLCTSVYGETLIPTLWKGLWRVQGDEVLGTEKIEASWSYQQCGIRIQGERSQVRVHTLEELYKNIERDFGLENIFLVD
jgi:hypothetical protein